MKETIIAILLSLLASFIYDTIKTFLKRKPTNTDSHEYTKKYFRDVKLEFYVSFPSGIFFSFISSYAPESMYVGMQTLAFFMFFVSLMAFTCLVEIVNNLSNNHSDDDVG